MASIAQEMSWSINFYRDTMIRQKNVDIMLSFYFMPVGRGMDGCVCERSNKEEVQWDGGRIESFYTLLAMYTYGILKASSTRETAA